MKVKATLSFVFDTEDDPETKGMPIDELREYMNKELSEPLTTAQGNVIDVKLLVEEVKE